VTVHGLILCFVAGGVIAVRDWVLGTPKPRGWRLRLADTALTMLIVALAVIAGAL